MLCGTPGCERRLAGKGPCGLLVLVDSNPEDRLRQGFADLNNCNFSIVVWAKALFKRLQPSLLPRATIFILNSLTKRHRVPLSPRWIVRNHLHR